MRKRAFVFATGIVQSLFYLNPKVRASSYVLPLYSPVCVRPGRKARRPGFSQRGSYISDDNRKMFCSFFVKIPEFNFNVMYDIVQDL